MSERGGQRSESLDTPPVSIGDNVKGIEEETAKQFTGSVVETTLRGLLLSEHKQIEGSSGRLDEGVN